MDMRVCPLNTSKRGGEGQMPSLAITVHISLSTTIVLYVVWRHYRSKDR